VALRRGGRAASGKGHRLTGLALPQNLPPVSDDATIENTLPEPVGCTLVVSARAPTTAEDDKHRYAIDYR
jgi:hypothetical protein